MARPCLDPSVELELELLELLEVPEEDSLE